MKEVKPKKVLAVNGSLRTGGNTAVSLSLLEEELEKEARKRAWSLEFEMIKLSSMDILPCRGCRICFDRGEESCPCKDQLLELHRSILAADCVVLASPVYVNDVSGTLKTVIDRLAFVCHRPAYSETPFFLMATTGGSPVRHTIRTMQAAVLSWGAPCIGTMGIKAGALSGRKVLLDRYKESLARKARMIVDYLNKEKHHSPGFFPLMVFAIQQKAWGKMFQESGTDTVDSRYWKEQGWLDPGCDYYIPNHSPRLRRFTARAFGRLIAGFMG
ncbi:MAG: flavodoxin family protein [Sediminispirochaetaceae bacterium]